MKLFLFKPPILRGTFPHMIMRPPSPVEDIWHKGLNLFSLKSFLKCQSSHFNALLSLQIRLRAPSLHQ